MSTTSATLEAAPRRTRALAVQLWDLFLMELTNWRWCWRGMLLTGTLTPLFSLLAFGVFARDSGPGALVYVMTGNIVVSLLFGTMSQVQSRVNWLRFQGGLDYVATLPIQRHIFLLAMVMSFLLLSLPSLLVTMTLGPILLGVPIRLSPLILIVVPLCALPLAGAGAVLGLAGRTPQESGNLTFLLILLLTGLGPVVIPPDHLPGFMLALGRLSPATYAASALRQAMVGPVTPLIVLDLAVLAGVAAALLWLAGRRMSWRQS